MIDVAEFLLARIAEDEEAALVASVRVWRFQRWNGEDRLIDVDDDQDPVVATFNGLDMEAIHAGRWYPARVLAECESKRRMIGFALKHGSAIDSEFGCCHDEEALRTGFRDWGDGDDPEPVPDGCLGVQAAREGLLILALPYADHPDYRSDWRI